jgi:SAM-dependent methyltransferase
VLEGGCGLGQYVALFSAEGYRVVGGDFSVAALAAHRRAQPASPLVALDLLRLPFADGVFGAHISLGVAEHAVDGPQALLRELRRTLAPGGALLLGVVWMNGWRRLTTPLVRRREARKRAAGIPFYQYAFSRAQLRSLLEDSGLRVLALHPYSPALGLRDLPLGRALVRLLRSFGQTRERSEPVTTPGQVSVAASGAVAPSASARVETERPRGLRRVLYWGPALAICAHMVLAVAVKPEG